MEIHQRMNTLILIPMAPNIPAALKARSLTIIQRMQRPGIQIVIDSRGPGDAGIATHTDRCANLADIRNALVRDYLRPLVELDSVGACYIAPARLFREGALYAAANPKYTDHYSVCQKAKQLGMKIMCDMRIRVSHVDLPKYGLHWHP